MAKCPATQKSLDHLRADPRNLHVEKVEHWDSYARRTKDLFGILDIVAVAPPITIGCQTTSYGNLTSRLRKIRESPVTPILLASGWTIVGHGWHKEKNKWVLKREVTITEDRWVSRTRKLPRAGGSLTWVEKEMESLSASAPMICAS